MVVGVYADFTIFEPGLIANSSNAALSEQCVTAMQSTLPCDPSLRLLASTEAFSLLPVSVLDTLCSADCGKSLASYHASVARACASDPEPWQGTPAVHYGDQIWAQYNLTCFKDSQNNYCQNKIANISTQASDMALSDYPTDVICSECILKLGQINQGTAYSNYGPRMAEAWKKIQSQCGVIFPTAVQAPVTNITSLPGFAPSGYATASCSGKTYTVVSGDNCGAIATKHSIPRGSLMTMNNILPDCSDLYIGQILCLPDACQTYTIQSGDTCNAITTSSNITLTQLRSWNPFVDSSCSNLIAGDAICINQPGPIWTGTTIAGATATKTAVYATATATSPGTLAYGTTSRCGKYYEVQTGDDCHLIALNFTISIGLFEAINPDINSDCTNLVPGLNYCVFPTRDWNETASGTTTAIVMAPAPTPSGTTENCLQWYVVQSGDYCAKIESAYAITMAQLQLWNPDLKDDCSNLQIDDAYCVQGGSAAASPASAYVSAPTSTPSGTTSKCFEWYTVQSGDYCGKIESAYAITMAQLQSWNPDLKDDCTNLQLGVSYCVQGDSS
ncbi:hypothetical protein QM012_000047 [Aureobasidium pullulans]|uniref:LysM domain-containing protein n=1 Tax=Aureobasidium pullulans TaxID=5580 RepID=A0ABR0TUK4_AURPU